MPMMFPDYESLRRAANVHGFRPPDPGEREDTYRRALVEHVKGRDLVEAAEIWVTQGWTEFDGEKYGQAVGAWIITEKFG